MPESSPRDALLKLRGDRSRCSLAEDEFGLREMAEIVADAVCTRVPTEGYAIGVEGRWGSGKTTLLNFIEGVLAKQNATVKVVHFEPWLVGKREGLLRDFFKQLSDKLAELQMDANVGTKLRHNGVLDRLVVRLARYANYLEVGNQVVSNVSILDPTWHSKVLSIVLKVLSLLFRWCAKPESSIEALKNEIVDDLQIVAKLVCNLRIVVIVDDSDRLDPNESVEIFRLIKAVANFPLLTYLVGFDQEILAKHVYTALHVDGRSYIEKVFQQVISLPPQEPFALRRYVQASLAKDFPREFEQSSTNDFDREERRNTVFDNWAGKLLKTPRDAVLLCEAVRFGWPYLEGKADFLDYVWLQLIKLKRHSLYQWVRDYTAELGAYRDNGRPSDVEASSAAAELKSQLELLGWGARPDRSCISDILPGLSDFDVTGEQATVFKFDDERERSVFESQQRLGSPSHWRYYFALDKPSYALDESDIKAFIRTAGSDWRAASDQLQALYERKHAKEGFFLEVLLDRLVDIKTAISTEERLGIAWAFSEKLDQFPRHPKNFLGADNWRSATKFLSPDISPVFPEIVEKGKSVNWLALVVRDQGFALGVTGQPRSAARSPWLTRSDFDLALKKIIARFHGMEITGILASPEPLQILYCWLQLGNADEVRQLLQQHSVSDSGFLDILGAMRIWVASTKDGTTARLQPDIVREFLDVEAVQLRLQKIVFCDDSTIAHRAKALLQSWKDSL